MKEKSEKQKKTFRCFFCKDILVDRFDFYWLCPAIYICPLCAEKRRQENPTLWSMLDVARLILSSLMLCSLLVVSLLLIHNFIPVDDSPIDWDKIPFVGILIEWTEAIVSVLFILLKVLFFTLLACVVACLPFLFFLMYFVERVPLRDYLVPVADVATFHAYVKFVKEAADKLNFIHCGDYQTEKNILFIPSKYSVWVSADGHMICIIEATRFLGFCNRRTLLYSWLQSEKVFRSSDQSTLYGTTAGVVVANTLVNADLFELAKSHNKLLSEAGSRSKLFSKDTAIKDFYSIERCIGAGLVSEGRACYCSIDKRVIRHTLQGAWRSTFIDVFKKNPQLAKQSDRYSIKRPGDPRYVPSNERCAGKGKDPAIITSRYTDDPNVSIDPEKVPEVLRHLVPLAKEWSIFDDVEMSAYEDSHTDAEMKEVANAVSPYYEDIEKFTSQGRDKTPVPDEMLIFEKLAEVASGR